MFRPFSLAALGGALAVLAVAPAAQAKIIEVGATGDQAIGTPACPGDNCITVTRTTGYQAKVGPTRGLYTVPANGRIVAWTVQLGKPTDKQIAFFDQNYGGAASAGIVVLRTGTHLRARTIAVSPLVKLVPYFGQTVQFPLAQSIAVQKGQVIALNVPTWAPSLAIGLGTDTSWRASRADRCNETATFAQQTSQGTIDALAQYRCLYRGVRLTYSATLVTQPQPNPPASTGKKRKPSKKQGR